MYLPQGASFAIGEAERIQSALAELAQDPHAPRQISVAVNLNVFREYPKHIQTPVGPIVVNSAEEEAALVLAEAPAEEVSAPQGE